MLRVLGIDPGLRITGYAAVDVAPGQLEPVLVEAGVLRLQAKTSLPERLGQLYRDLTALVEELHPQHMAVEKLYVHYKHAAHGDPDGTRPRGDFALRPGAGADRRGPAGDAGQEGGYRQRACLEAAGAARRAEPVPPGRSPQPARRCRRDRHRPHARPPPGGDRVRQRRPELSLPAEASVQAVRETRGFETFIFHSCAYRVARLNMWRAPAAIRARIAIVTTTSTTKRINTCGLVRSRWLALEPILAHTMGAQGFAQDRAQQVRAPGHARSRRRHWSARTAWGGCG